jgi:hypothetical protein
MVLNSQYSLTASTTLASIVSAAVLTVIGLCVPYTERAAKNRAAPAAHFTQGQAMKSSPAPHRGDTGPRGAGSPARSGSDNSARH